jgi:AraC-like DNA-binding protein
MRPARRDSRVLASAPYDLATSGDRVIAVSCGAVLVASRLAPRMAAHLSYVARGAHRVIAADTWSELVNTVHLQPVDMAVVDVDAETTEIRSGATQPLDSVASATEALRAIRALQQAAVPILVYTTVTTDTARHLVDLVDCGIQQYVFRGVDDQPSRFLDRLDGLLRNGLEDRVLVSALETLARRGASSLVMAVVRQLFRAPERFRVASDLAMVAGCTRAHFNETLRRAGLAPGRTLVLAARLLRAYHYGHRTTATATAVAARLRYESAEMFRRHVHQFTGTSFAAWCRQTPEQCVLAIRSRLECTGDSARRLPPERPRSTRLRLVG